MRGPRGKSSWPHLEQLRLTFWQHTCCPTSSLAPETNEPRGWACPPAREGEAPQRLVLARKPAIRYDTLPDVRQTLPPP
jgi:hypothetical protein